MKKLTKLTQVAALSLLSLLLGSSLEAHADSACHEGGVVATSQNGQVEVGEGAHGCRAYPTASYTITGGVRDYEISSLPYHSALYVSDTGRTLLLVGEHSRADQDSVTLFRDGRRHGSYTLAELLGDRVSAGAGSVQPRIEGLDLVIYGATGNSLSELSRVYVGALPFRR